MTTTPKLGKWTPDEIHLLKKLFPGNPTAEVAEILDRPVEAVKKKAGRLTLVKNTKRRKELGRK